MENKFLFHGKKEGSQKKRRRKQRAVSLLAALALIASTGYSAAIPGSSVEAGKKLICEQEESTGHMHGAECYTESSVLICGQEESAGHAHGSECYKENTTVICGQEESAGHTHGSECYKENTTVICGQEESAGHTHGNECYTEKQNLICELEEHAHTEDCYETVSELTCGQEEKAGHTHGPECMQTTKELICGQAESAGHVHGEECLQTTKELICSQAESAGHTHSDACYQTESKLTCTLEESTGHTHQESCWQEEKKETSDTKRKKSTEAAEDERDGEAVYLGDYIESITVEARENGSNSNWTELEKEIKTATKEALEVNETQEIRFTIEYKISGKALKETDSVKYELPVKSKEAKTVDKKEVAYGSDKKTELGTCITDKNGKVTITFSDKYLEKNDNGTAIEGIYQVLMNAEDIAFDAEGSAVIEFLKSEDAAAKASRSADEMIAIAFEAETEEETQAQSEKETQVQLNAENEEEAQEQPETETEAETQEQPETETEAETQAQTEIETETETEIQTEIETETETEAQTEIETEIQTEIETETEIQSEIKIETEIMAETEMTLSSSGENVSATVSCDDNVLPEGAVLQVSEIEETADIETIIESALKEQGKTITAIYPYDISFADSEGAAVEPDGTVNVELSFSDSIVPKGDSSEWYLFHITDEGVVENLTGEETTVITVDEATGAVAAFKFASSTFSPYVLAEAESEAEVTYICWMEEHTHTVEAGCFDANGNLICELEEHTHTEECIGVTLTEEERAQVDAVIAMIDLLPTYEEVEETMLSYEEDMEGLETYLMEVAEQAKAAYDAYELLQDYQKAYVYNVDKLMDLEWLWSMTTYADTDILPSKGEWPTTTISEDTEVSLTGNVTLSGTITVAAGKTLAINLSEDVSGDVSIKRTFADSAGTKIDKTGAMMFNLEKGSKVYIYGNGSQRIIIDGGNTFNLTPQSANSGVTGTYSGIGFYVKEAELKLENVTIQNMYAKSGDGACAIHQAGTTSTHENHVFTLNNVILQNCLSNDDTGIVRLSGNAEITNSQFLNSCVNERYGGIVKAGGSNVYCRMTMTGCTFSGNYSSGWGGGLLWAANRKHSGNGSYSHAYLSGCTFTNNTAEYLGGGLSNEAMMTLTNCTIQNNTAAAGGGIATFPFTLTGDEKVEFNNACGLTIGSGNVIQNNNSTATGDFTPFKGVITNEITYPAGGGGIWCYMNKEAWTCSMDIGAGNTISGNYSAADGGGVYVHKQAGSTTSLTISGANITGNTAVKGGGGVALHDADLSITAGSLNSNTANIGGGAYVYQGNLTVSGGTVSGNTAVNGGGFYLDQTDNAYTTTISDGMITGNTASKQSDGTGGYGGGIYQVGVNSNCIVNGSGTINENTASNGGGIYLESGSMQVDGGSITKNTATGTPTEVSTTYNNAADRGVGGGIYIASGSFKLGDGAGQNQKKAVAICENLADYAADDVYASGVGTSLDIPAVEFMTTGFNVGAAWYEDYHSPEDNYKTKWPGGVDHDNNGRYRELGLFNGHSMSTANLNTTNAFVNATIGINEDVTLTIEKINSENQHLADADFTLQYNVEGNWVNVKESSFTTNAEGKISVTFSPSKAVYRLVETEAPAGYIKLLEPVYFKFTTSTIVFCDENGTVLTSNEYPENVSMKTTGELALIVTNITGAVLPLTGGTGTTLYTMGGLLTILAAGWLLLYNQKRGKEAKVSS